LRTTLPNKNMHCIALLYFLMQVFHGMLTNYPIKN